MSLETPLIPLGQAVTPVERPEIPYPGKKYRQLGVRLWGEGAYERESIDGSETNYRTLSRVEENDIVVNKIWARNGSVSIVNSFLAGCYVSGEFPTFTPIRDKLEPRWFYWLTKTKPFWEQCDKKSRGTSGQNRIRPEKFLEVEIPLPPLDEQWRIVARIEELAAKVEEARGLRRQSAEEAEFFFQSVLSKVTSGFQTPLEPLENLCLHITDGEHNTPQRIPFAGIPLATAKNVRDGYLDLSFTDFVDSDTAEKCWRRCQPQHEDILMVCVGATIGRVCRLENPPPIVIVRSVALLRPNKNFIDSRFLEYALESAVCQQQVWSSVKQAAQPCLYLNRMKQLLIPLPSLPEQHRIVAYLDNLQTKVDALKRLQTETAAELDALLPSILDKAFKGEL